jgi:hypothetical protein
MSDPSALKRQILEAFADIEYPGDWCLRRSNEGDEPFLLEDEFKGKADWHALDRKFLDQAPAGFGTALCFFSDEAFRFYLPAYLIADIDAPLERHDLTFQLTYGLTDSEMPQQSNPRRYGDRTLFDESRYRFATFNKAQVAAIVAYLEFKREQDEDEQERIDESFKNYWRDRVA